MSPFYQKASFIQNRCLHNSTQQSFTLINVENSLFYSRLYLIIINKQIRRNKKHLFHFPYTKKPKKLSEKKTQFSNHHKILSNFTCHMNKKIYHKIQKSKSNSRVCFTIKIQSSIKNRFYE